MDARDIWKFLARAAPPVESHELGAGGGHPGVGPHPGAGPPLTRNK